MFKKERISYNLDSAVYKYKGKRTEDNPNGDWPKETIDGPFYMKDFFDERGNRYGDCAELIVDSFEDLDREMENAKNRNELSLIEVKCSIGARNDLGRPTTTTLENKQNFMECLKTL